MLLNAKILGFTSYWKYEMIFSGVYDNHNITVKLYTNNDNGICELPLNTLLSITDLSNSYPINIVCSKLDVNVDDNKNSLSNELNDDDDDIPNQILDLTEDEYVPTLLHNNIVTFRTMYGKKKQHLDYTSDLTLKYYTLDEIKYF